MWSWKGKISFKNQLGSVSVEQVEGFMWTTFFPKKKDKFVQMEEEKKVVPDHLRTLIWFLTPSILSIKCLQKSTHFSREAMRGGKGEGFDTGPVV